MGHPAKALHLHGNCSVGSSVLDASQEVIDLYPSQRALVRNLSILAEQNDQIGAPDCIGECTECGVIEAARAFHDGGRDLRRGFDPRQQIATGTIGQRGTGEQERSLRGRDDIKDGIGHRFAKRDRRRSECGWRRPGEGVARDQRGGGARAGDAAHDDASPSS